MSGGMFSFQVAGTKRWKNSESRNSPRKQRAKGLGISATARRSTQTMPAWLGAIAQWNPISTTATAARELFGNATGVAGHGWAEENAIILAAVLPFVLVVVFLPLSARAYRRLRR